MGDEWVNVTNRVNWERILMNPVPWESIHKMAMSYLRAQRDLVEVEFRPDEDHRFGGRYFAKKK